MERKIKQCGICNLPKVMWKARTRDHTAMCKECALKNATPIGGYKMTTQVKTIPKVSSKQIERLKSYKIARKEYLLDHADCEAKIESVCVRIANQIHHRAGRCGSLLTDRKYFLAVCSECHHKIEINPTWAKEKGFSVDRLDK